MSKQSDEQARGISRLTAMLPALSDYVDPRDDSPRDTCAVCRDGECGGACQGAMEVVRQVIDALGCGDDDWDWWCESFAEDGVTIPPAEPTRHEDGCGLAWADCECPGPADLGAC